MAAARRLGNFGFLRKKSSGHFLSCQLPILFADLVLHVDYWALFTVDLDGVDPLCNTEAKEKSPPES